MAVLGLRFCARAFSSCGKRGPLFIAARGPLTIVVAGGFLTTAPPEKSPVVLVNGLRGHS